MYTIRIECQIVMSSVYMLLFRKEKCPHALDLVYFSLQRSTLQLSKTVVRLELMFLDCTNTLVLNVVGEDIVCHFLSTTKMDPLCSQYFSVADTDTLQLYHLKWVFFWQTLLQLNGQMHSIAGSFVQSHCLLLL